MTFAGRPILRNAMLAAGTGVPVLLLHGSASAAVMWASVIDALKAQFRVVAPDLIGLRPDRFLAQRPRLHGRR
jgi:pimeloyl-ACP methyl ester carboxylesterase